MDNRVDLNSAGSNLNFLHDALVKLLDHTTLLRPRRGQPSQQDRIPKSRQLTNLEEQAIVQYVLDLDSRAFPPRLRDVENMAIKLLAERDAPPVGKLRE